jgi:hypothetical protein
MSLSMELPPNGGYPEPARLAEDLVRELEVRLDQEQAKGRLPTLIVGVVRDGALLLAG